jgi:acetyl esterase/lipase
MIRAFRTIVSLSIAMLTSTGCVAVPLANRLLVPDHGYTLKDGLAYGPNARQRLDVYTPRDLERPAPVVVFFYGGGWRSGERGYYRFLGEALTSRGFVAVVADYRLFPEVRYPAFLEDAAAAVRWTRDRIGDHGGDPARIFLMGHSAGAHTTAMLAVDGGYLREAGVSPEAVRGVIGLAGPYAFDPFRYRSTRPIFATVAVAEETQPISYVTGDEPPVLLLHGVRDRTVYPENSQTLAARLRAAGSPATLVQYDGLGHIGLILSIARPLRKNGGTLDTIAEFVQTEAAYPAARSSRGEQQLQAGPIAGCSLEKTLDADGEARQDTESLPPVKAIP